jgi:hypothetical protein
MHPLVAKLWVATAPIAMSLGAPTLLARMAVGLLYYMVEKRKQPPATTLECARKLSEVGL